MSSLQRPSVALKRHHRKNRALLSLPEATLASQMACRGGNPLNELRHAARTTNRQIRNQYADFIHTVGRNVFPLIIFTDHEVDGPEGVGSTLTLYQSNGSVTKVSPALDTSYEIYKACSHVFMGLSVEIGPYLGEEDVADVAGPYSDDASEAEEKKDDENGLQLSNGESVEDVPWRASLLEYVQQVRVFRRALIRVPAETDVTDVTEGMGKLEIPEDGSEDALPSPELRGTMLSMLSSVIEFCESCLATGFLDAQRWKQLNMQQFSSIKRCMREAAKLQADACVPQIIEWRDMLGPDEWRELYVVIPTVWAVDGENPRKTMMRQLMDVDRIDTHIITSEYPRNHSEARTLLGRVVGDRAIGRFVFGDETKGQKIKAMGLSSEIDVVQDDALPAIWNAVRKNGCPVRHTILRSSSSSDSSGGSSASCPRNRRVSARPSFC